MSTTNVNAVLQFRSSTNERIQITIPRARTDTTQAQATAAMQAMIDGNAILTGFGRPAAIKAADLVATERTTIWQPPGA